MPTLIEMAEPEVLDQTEVADPCPHELAIAGEPIVAPTPPISQLLFSDSLLGSSQAKFQIAE